MSSRRTVGRRGEAVARRRLEAAGYVTAAANQRTRYGELDLVMEKDGVLVFVEVRASTSRTMGLPEESVDADKRSRLVAAAQAFLQSRAGPTPEWRIDVVAVELDRFGRARRVRHIESAVER